MEVGAGRTGGPAGGGTKCGNLAVGIGSTCGGGVGQRVGTGLMNGGGGRVPRALSGPPSCMQITQITMQPAAGC